MISEVLWDTPTRSPELSGRHWTGDISPELGTAAAAGLDAGVNFVLFTVTTEAAGAG